MHNFDVVRHFNEFESQNTMFMLPPFLRHIGEELWPPAPLGSCWKVINRELEVGLYPACSGWWYMYICSKICTHTQKNPQKSGKVST